jgi:AcrR family transcriptional regulator
MQKKIQKRRSTQERQKQIIEASRKLVIKYGSEHITVRKIANYIGISEGAIYRHFESKNDIFLFLIDYIENSWLEDIKLSLDHNKPTLDILKSLAEKHISEVEQRKGVTFQVVAEIISLGDKKLNRKISASIQKYLQKINEIISKGIQNGDIQNAVDIEASAILFFSMIQGLTNIWVLNNYSFNLVDKFKPVWEVYFRSMKSF